MKFLDIIQDSVLDKNRTMDNVRKHNISNRRIVDRLYGLEVRVSGYISRGPRLDSHPYQIF
jgi:hypothetical protein